MAFKPVTRFERFTEQTKVVVWNKARIIPNFDPRIWRWDMCGNVMRFEKYGVCGEHGWEIDHIKPIALGGTDALANLQPLYWENNRRKGDTYPWFG